LVRGRRRTLKLADEIDMTVFLPLTLLEKIKV